MTIFVINCFDLIVKVIYKKKKRKILSQVIKPSWFQEHFDENRKLKEPDKPSTSTLISKYISAVCCLFDKLKVRGFYFRLPIVVATPVHTKALLYTRSRKTPFCKNWWAIAISLVESNFHQTFFSGSGKLSWLWHDYKIDPGIYSFPLYKF